MNTYNLLKYYNNQYNTSYKNLKDLLKNNPIIVSNPKKFNDNSCPYFIISNLNKILKIALKLNIKISIDDEYFLLFSYNNCDRTLGNIIEFILFQCDNKTIKLLLKNKYKLNITNNQLIEYFNSFNNNWEINDANQLYFKNNILLQIFMKKLEYIPQDKNWFPKVMSKYKSFFQKLIFKLYLINPSYLI
jgi:hypothetical protein